MTRTGEPSIFVFLWTNTKSVLEYKNPSIDSEFYRSREGGGGGGGGVAPPGPSPGSATEYYYFGLT